MNKVYIIGRIARDLELKSFGDDNRSYIQFPLAVNEYNSYSKEQITDFIDQKVYRTSVVLDNFDFIEKKNSI